MKKELETQMESLEPWHTCVDCGGPTHAFVVPDKVWDGLGFPLEAFACFGCFAKRLNPSDPPDVEHIDDEIYKQRKRFRLKRFNRFLGEKEIGIKNEGRYFLLCRFTP